MAENAHAPGRGPKGVAVIDLDEQIAAEDSSPRTARQDPPPLERHRPLADDKRALFEVAPVYRLRGTWQGPGSIAKLRLGVR